MKNLLTILFLSITIISVGQEKVLLRLNYEKGDFYDMNVSLTQKMGESLMSMETKVVMTQEVKSVAKEYFQSDIKITNIVMDMTQSGMNIFYDSSKKEDELDESVRMMKTQFDPMLKATISVKSNKLGDILQTEVTPNILGTAALTQQASNIVYPEKAVAVGDSWSMNREEKGMRFAFIYKVASITAEKVLLDVLGKVEGIATGDITGSMTIDKKTGLLEVSKIDMKMKVQDKDLKTSINTTMVKR